MPHHQPWQKVTYKPGQISLLYGANGSGKTTWLRHLAAAWAPTYYSGHTLGWIPHITVAENIHLWGKLYGAPTTIHATPYDHQLWGDLSQGQKQYIAFVGAVSSRCALWLMDEPFAHMDAHHIEQTQAMCRHHCENGGALVLTAHTPNIDFWDHVQRWHVPPNNFS